MYVGWGRQEKVGGEDREKGGWGGGTDGQVAGDATILLLQNNHCILLLAYLSRHLDLGADRRVLALPTILLRVCMPEPRARLFVTLPLNKIDINICVYI